MSEYLKMSKDELESGYYRAFYDMREYSRSPQDDTEVSFGLFSSGGGTIGEIIMQWSLVGGKMTAQMKSYHDSWKVLSCFGDLIDALAEFDSAHITPDGFIEILKLHGFIDPKTEFKGDYMPDHMFAQYQKRRLRDKKLKQLNVNN